MKTKCLSLGGKVTLIKSIMKSKSVMSSIPMYILAVTEAPKCTLDYIDKLITFFLGTIGLAGLQIRSKY